jgi:hypothetical protein
LTVNFRQDADSNTVEVELRNLTSFISVDSVIELVGVATGCVGAVVGVIEALSVDPAGDVVGNTSGEGLGNCHQSYLPLDP